MGSFLGNDWQVSVGTCAVLTFNTHECQQFYNFLEGQPHFISKSGTLGNS